MRFIADRETILKPLHVVRGVIEQRQPMPVLTNLLVRARDGLLAFKATDTEVELEARATVDELDGDGITVPARKFVDICNALPSEARIDFGLDSDGRAHIRSGRSRFTLTTIPAREFPTTDEIADEFEFPVGQGDLKQLIDLTQFAMARQDVRYYLNGMLLEISAGEVKAVGTDGHRLAVARIECQTGIDDPRSIIVPRKGVLELSRLLASDDTELRVRAGSNAIEMTIGDVRFGSKLIDGKFPDYGRVVPDPARCDKRLTLNSEELRQCLVRASVLSTDKHRTIRLSLEPGTLSVLAHNAEQESAEDQIEVEYTGEALEIGFNVAYLIDALTTLPSEFADVFLTDSSSSCLIQPAGSDACQFVVMPMRL